MSALAVGYLCGGLAATSLLACHFPIIGTVLGILGGSVAIQLMNGGRR